MVGIRRVRLPMSFMFLFCIFIIIPPFLTIRVGSIFFCQRLIFLDKCTCGCVEACKYNCLGAFVPICSIVRLVRCLLFYTFVSSSPLCCFLVERWELCVPPLPFPPFRSFIMNSLIACRITSEFVEYPILLSSRYSLTRSMSSMGIATVVCLGSILLTSQV